MHYLQTIKLEAKGGKPLLKRKSIAKLVEMKQSLRHLRLEIVILKILHVTKTILPHI